MAVENLIIWQKLKELHSYTVTVIRHYPKSERFILGQRTQGKILDMVDTTIAAYFIISAVARNSDASSPVACD